MLLSTRMAFDFVAAWCSSHQCRLGAAACKQVVAEWKMLPYSMPLSISALPAYEAPGSNYCLQGASNGAATRSNKQHCSVAMPAYQLCTLSSAETMVSDLLPQNS